MKPKKYPSKNRPTPKASKTQKTDAQFPRLNKYIANAGICSRRAADVYIESGNVTVNGKLITEMGYRVKQGDEVRFDGQILTLEKKRYLLMNKPKNYITTMDDERGRKTVMELVAGVTKERVYPVGRLDRNTTGVLLLTNDGELAKKLTHPKHKIKKLYHVVLERSFALADLEKLRSGTIVVEGRPVKIDDAAYVEGGKKSEMGIEIHSGRNRIVRKIFELLGYKITKLDRVAFAGLTKKNVSRGHYRHLTEKEIGFLKML